MVDFGSMACCSGVPGLPILLAGFAALAGVLVYLFIRTRGSCGASAIAASDYLVAYYTQREAEGDDAGLRAELSEALEVLRGGLTKPEDAERRDALDNLRLDLLVRDRRVVDVARELGRLIESDRKLLTVFQQGQPPSGAA